MYARLTATRARFRSTLTAEQLRGVKILGWVTVVVLAGLTLTGSWQFFTHESDPGWFDHLIGSESRQPAATSTGVADLHSTFSTAAGVLALLGGAWYAYKVIFDIPWVAVFGVGVVLFGSITGSTIRFNAVKLEGQPFEDADVGYLQLFGSDLEFVVTDKWDLGTTAIRLLTVSHLLALPVLLAVAWFSLPKANTPSSATTEPRR